MQAVAAEMNLSETAFLVPRDDGDHDLRWFTPTAEVDLCGHATLASAHVLGGDRTSPPRRRVRCRSARRRHHRHGLPGHRRRAGGRPARLVGALGLAPDRVVAVYDNPDQWVLAELASPADVRAAVPDTAAIEALSGYITVAAAPGDAPGVDSVCRVFAPVPASRRTR